MCGYICELFMPWSALVEMYGLAVSLKFIYNNYYIYTGSSPYYSLTANVVSSTAAATLGVLLAAVSIILLVFVVGCVVITYRRPRKYTVLA